MTNNKKRYILNLLAVILSFVAFKLLMNFGIIDAYYEGLLLMVGINIILATSLNMTTGFLGQLTLGHAGFMAAGAYAASLFTMNSGLEVPDTLHLIMALVVGGLVASVFGFIVGVPALRLRGDYLGIITLGFGEIIRVLLVNLEITGGAIGLRNIPLLSDFNNIYWIMVIVVAVIFSLMNSRHGRSIISIRENEIAAEAVGINTSFYKIFTFVLSAFFAGVAGGLFAHLMTVLDPKKFNFMFSIEILVMVVLGGMGSITGSIIAAIILTFLPELLRDFSDYRLLIYALVLLLMMLFRPTGLLGTREFSLFRKRAKEDVKTSGLGGEE